MRSILMAAIAAASVLVANLASAEVAGCSGPRRPLVTVDPTPVGTPVLTAEIGGK